MQRENSLCIVSMQPIRRALKKNTTKFWTYVQIRSTLRTLYTNNMDKNKVWTSTLLSTLPTYPKKLDILESKLALFQIFLILSAIQ